MLKAKQIVEGTITIGKPSSQVEVSKIEGGHKIKVTDPNGTQELNVMDGAKGEDLVITEVAKGNPIVVSDVSPVEHEIKVKTSASNVSRYGKNLVDISKGLKDTVLVMNNDGSYTLTKTGSGELRFSKRMPLLISANTPITVSLNIIDINTVATGVYLVFGCSNGTEITKTVLTNRTFTFDKDVNDLRIYIGDSEENGSYVRFEKLQIEIGETATEYESVKVQTAEVIDGTATLKSVYPTMTLIADADMEVVYNSDTKLYVDKKLAELVKEATR